MLRSHGSPDGNGYRVRLAPGMRVKYDGGSGFVVSTDGESCMVRPDTNAPATKRRIADLLVFPAATAAKRDLLDEARHLIECAESERRQAAQPMPDWVGG